jgi:hypothetical protein
MVRVSYRDREYIPEVDVPLAETELERLDALYEGPQVRPSAKVVTVDVDTRPLLVEDDDGGA